MQQRNIAEDVKNKRMLGIDEASQYIGMGRNYTRELMRQIGAERHFGRRVLFDKQIIDKALNQLGKEDKT